MFKLFKNHKAEEAPKVENIEELPEGQVETLETEEKLVDSEPIDVRLEALTDYFEQCEKNGIEMTKEMVETEIRDRLGLEVEDLLGEEITNPELKLTHQEIISKINSLMEQKAEEKGTALSFLRDKVFKSKFAKAAFVTALLFLKFNPAQAADHKENVKDKIEHEVKKPVSHEGDGDKTFKTTFEDFGGHIVISATSNFETDKADLKDGAKLAADFDKFLSSIDKDNFNDLINQDWVVKGSSDERKTSRPGGNSTLTHDRIDALKSVLEETLKSHGFGVKLTSEQIDKILAKEIKEVFPTSGAEQGVTYLTDLVNPASGQHYTEAEIKTIKETNPSEYHKMLEKCRYTNFELDVKKEVPKTEVIKTPPPTVPEKPIDKPTIFSPKVYDNYYLLVDNSPSMGTTKKNMSKELAGLNIDKPFKVANYSEDLSGISYEKNSEQAAKKLMKMDTEHGSSKELSFSSAIKFLEKVEKGQHKDIKKGIALPEGVLYVATDETLQDVDKIEKLKELSTKTNVEVKILVFYSKGNKVLKLSLDDIQEQMKANNIVKYRDRTVMKNLYDSNGKAVALLGH